MSVVLYTIAGILSLAVAGYLVFALFKAEKL